MNTANSRPAAVAVPQALIAGSMALVLAALSACGFEPLLGRATASGHELPDGGTGCVVGNVFFAADMNEGTLDDNCDPIDRFLWAEDKPGASMFFAAGIHPDSPIQDNAIEQMLGAWQPNLIPMHDDGTCGDEVASDGIWTISFDLPVGLRIGYKYTWGLQGENWGGTEEWPGNRRLLEIVDVNGDGVVARFDEFGDQTTNKDKANQLLPANGGRGSIDWETDANGDGIPDARERMVDTDGDCVLDTWWTPSTAGG
ncbi:MAG: hypothetical protein D6806_06235 [Deltaproteobacteria bacterium]|nr:MAG: hypothetical protein D6806_06235 [Deltaproteobacteria bacterium]